MDSRPLGSYIDHTLLKADTNEAAVRKLCAEAIEFGFYSVCVNSRWVPVCRDALVGSNVGISVVCGFPLGAMSSSAKAFEAANAAEQGATEIDMVLQIGELLAGQYAVVESDIRRVVDAVAGQAIVKVIMETGYLNDEQKRIACQLSEQAGAHYVKTSTGFGPGGATEADIRLMRRSVSPSIGVKASGGVRDRAAALAMIEAGATRIGTSSGITIVSGNSGNSSSGY